MSYSQIGAEIGALVTKKHEAYGRSFEKTGKLLELLYPTSIKPEQYHQAAVIVRVLDKLCRIAHDNDPFGESPWQDIAGYAILQMAHSTARVDQVRTEVAA